jgi:hypothetical protein
MSLLGHRAALALLASSLAVVAACEKKLPVASAGPVNPASLLVPQAAQSNSPS